jgi:hypothetical protein
MLNSSFIVACAESNFCSVRSHAYNICFGNSVQNDQAVYEMVFGSAVYVLIKESKFNERQKRGSIIGVHLGYWCTNLGRLEKSCK